MSNIISRFRDDVSQAVVRVFTHYLDAYRPEAETIYGTKKNFSVSPWKKLATSAVVRALTYHPTSFLGKKYIATPACPVGREAWKNAFVLSVVSKI